MKMDFTKKLCALFIGICAFAAGEPAGSPRDPMKFVRDMGTGWNLGNTLDATGGDETVWGNPKTSQTLINAIAARGFKTIRIPVTWWEHTGPAPDFTIEKAWMDRVEEVVNYAFANDMIVILNTHHEERWAIPTDEHVDDVSTKLTAIWTQIATRFNQYDDHLILEPLNEPRQKKTPLEWMGGTKENRDCVNRYQKVCVDAIRATGGNNATRMLMVSTHSASSHTNAIQDLIIPNNDPNILISIHLYSPPDFCLDDRPDWGTPADIQKLQNEFAALEKQFIDQGRGVVLGEWGSLNNDNPTDRLRHARAYMKLAAQHGMCPVWWDNGLPGEFGLINRTTFEWIYPELADIVSGTPKQFK